MLWVMYKKQQKLSKIEDTTIFIHAMMQNKLKKISENVLIIGIKK